MESLSVEIIAVDGKLGEISADILLHEVLCSYVYHCEDQYAILSSVSVPTFQTIVLPSTLGPRT